jgi:hypothetical protein
MRTPLQFFGVDIDVDKGFGQVFARLHVNEDLNSYDRDVYSVLFMLGWLTGRTPELFQSALADYLRISQRQVNKSIGKLLKTGEIAAEHAIGGPSVYRILRYVPPAQSKSPGVETKPRMMCPACLKPRTRFNKAGVCFKCAAEARVTQKIEDALRELGPDVPAATVLAYAHVPKEFLHKGRRILERIA